jgi:4-hydroxymandelate oxidase
MRKNQITRRQALAGFGSLAAAAPLAADQPPKLIGEPPGRIAPMADLVNVLEFENVAERKLSPQVFATIAGGDRSYFDRITFRPRMMVPTTNLDLTVDLFGDKLFTPIMVGPVSRQQAFHPDGELATVRGASAAKAAMVVSSDSSVPLEKIAAESKTSLWYQDFPDRDVNAARGRIQQAVKAGCKAVCITVGAPYRAAGASGPPNPSHLPALASPAISWSVIDQLRQGLSVPFLLKGIMSPEEAQSAVQKGVQGIVVSNYGGLLTPGLASPIEMLPAIADAVGGRVPVLVDGGFRRGSDILKALVLGAQGVLLARPVLWGLSAYGAEGVQGVLEMLQTELGRSIAQCSKPNLKALDRSVVKIHQA